MILRLTQKLATKLKEGPLSSVAMDDNPLADWTAHLFVVDRTQHILLTNTKTLYCVIMHGRGCTNGHQFIERALTAIGEFMKADGLGEVYQRFIAPASDEVQFAKGLDRRITG